MLRADQERVLSQGSKIKLDLAGIRNGQVSILVLLYIIAVFLPVGFSLGPVFLTLVRLLLLVTIIPLSINLLMGKYGRLLWIDVFFFLHVGWILVSLLVNNPNQAIANAGSTGIEFIGGYILGRACIRDRDDFIALVRTLVYFVFACFPFALYETLTGTAVIANLVNSIPGVSSNPDLSPGRRMGLDRVQMVFVHPIHWGLFCAVVLSLCFVGFKDIFSNTFRIICALVICISGFLALSSGALLAMVMQFILIFWAWVFRSSERRWVILLSVIAVFYVIIDLLSDRTPIMVFLSYATFSSHTAYWRTIIFEWGMVNVWANPVFGQGLNDWVRPIWMFSGSLDNFWLLIAVRFGIPGFLFLAVGYVIGIWKIGRRKFDDDQVLWNLRRAWMFSFIGLTFTLSTVHIWHTVYSFVFFMFGSGMWLLYAKPQSPDRNAFGLDNVVKPDTDRSRFTRQGSDKSTSSASAEIGQEAASSRPSYTRFPPKK